MTVAFDPQDPRSVLAWTDQDIAALPRAEDDTVEYKSNRTPDDKLAEKIERAASGMWNSGGGVFVAGVDGEGRPDGGLSPRVGRQARRDWIDQIVARVSPRASYTVHAVEDQGAGLSIVTGNAVFIIAFGESSAGPHAVTTSEPARTRFLHRISSSTLYSPGAGLPGPYYAPWPDESPRATGSSNSSSWR